MKFLCITRSREIARKITNLAVKVTFLLRLYGLPVVNVRLNIFSHKKDINVESNNIQSFASVVLF